MKTRSMMAGLAMALLPCGVLAADENPGLQSIAAALRPVLEKLEPKADIAYSNNASSLIVSYRTQPYKIHGRSMTGEVSLEAHDEIGPSFKGFVLNVHLQERGEINQVVTPQTLRGPYWETYLNVTPIGATRKQIYWALSAGSRTDPNLLAQIREVLEAFKDAPENRGK